MHTINSTAVGLGVLRREYLAVKEAENSNKQLLSNKNDQSHCHGYKRQNIPHAVIYPVIHLISQETEINAAIPKKENVITPDFIVIPLQICCHNNAGCTLLYLSKFLFFYISPQRLESLYVYKTTTLSLQLESLSIVLKLPLIRLYRQAETTIEIARTSLVLYIFHYWAPVLSVP